MSDTTTSIDRCKNPGTVLRTHHEPLCMLGRAWWWWVFDAYGHTTVSSYYSLQLFSYNSFIYMYNLLFYLTPPVLHRQGKALSMAGGTKQDGQLVEARLSRHLD